MPLIENPTEQDVCAYCGLPALYISYNTKTKRCQKSITKCPEIIRRQKESREARTTPEERSSHAKRMAERARKSIDEKSKDPEWVKNRNENISNAKKGKTIGENNPMFGKTHSEDAKEKMKRSAAVRDNSRIGRYTRTEKHKDATSRNVISLIKSGRLGSNTKPERKMIEIMSSLGIEYEQQFLIQFKKTKNSNWRHCYDFLIKNTNILVEVDGDYWHSKPETIKRDNECELIADSLGYRVIRFKESEIYNNPETVSSILVNSIH